MTGVGIPLLLLLLLTRSPLLRLTTAATTTLKPEVPTRTLQEERKTEISSLIPKPQAPNSES